MKKILFDKTVLSWALYDWANSAFATTVVAGFFPVFYTLLSAELTTRDAQFWFNITLAVSSILIAIAAPVLGAIADRGGRRKKFLATFAMLGILMSAGLAWVGAGMWWMGLLIYGLGQIGFSGANIFYDAMIVDLSSEEDLDVVSGYGYALGYAGGGILFLVNVLMVTKPQLFGLADPGTALSLSFISVAIWWAIFTAPLLWVVKETTSQSQTTLAQTTLAQTTFGQSIRQGFQQLRITYRELRQLKAALLFLAGYWLYIDGVGTIYKMAIFFANRVLELPQESLITALLLTQFVAFPAALFFGWLGKRIGPKSGILIGLIVYTLAVFYAWGWLDSAADFYKLAVAIGLVQGGVQSLSRSLFARLIPISKTAEFFGFFNMVGKFASILGPLLMAAVPVLFARSEARDSILVLVMLFAAGGYVLLKVNVKNGIQAAKDIEYKLTPH
ncbi:MFS transporter [Candidatus Spongiihabitans sp.]|uniref:MFS transporter n=1 Tax=Candidatus Spongiihabitans sp. TaxID=3101308 RepID=UPI003C6FE955